CAISADGSRAASCSDADRVRVWETRTRQCVAQIHSNRNVQVSSVQIVRRATHVPGPPPFQPFQRMLTSPEDAPALPLSRAGRSSALTEAMAPHAKAQGFLDSVQWSSAAAVPSVVSGAPSSGTAGAALAPSAPQELEEQLAQARAGEARWARIASDLYGRLVEKGLDSAASVLLSNARPAAPMVVSAAASPAAPVAIAAPSA
ncbi:unnamed protein product, partial [Polarella glacialis]